MCKQNINRVFINRNSVIYIPSNYVMTFELLALGEMLHPEVTLAWYFVRLACLSLTYRC